MSDTSIALQNYPTKDETNDLIAKSEQRTLSTVSQNYPNNTTFNNTITDTKQELNNSLNSKLSSTAFNDFVTQYNTDRSALQAADANNSQSINNTNLRVDEAFSNISNLNTALSNKFQVIDSADKATENDVLYIVY